MDHRVYLGDWTSRTPHHARIEDLLTERLTLAIPRLCHNAQADLLRKQQVLGSNPSVGSTPWIGEDVRGVLEPSARR